ncbi:sugar phosphate isomerase/epimerase family protein [Paenibacillus marinisediminis]
MKWSLFTVAVPDLTIDELIPAAAEAGLNGLEWRFTSTAESARQQPSSFWGNNLATIEPGVSAARLSEIRSLCKANGIESAGLMAYLQVGNLVTAREAVETAAALGAPSMRIAAHRYDRSRPYAELLAEQLQYMEQLAPMLQEYGVKGLIETHHGTIAASASAAHRIVSAFDESIFGVLFDPGNMVFEGYENYRMGLELLGPYLSHVHVKNADVIPYDKRENASFTWSPLQRGLVDWQQVMSDLIAVGYDGYCGCEDFSGTYSSREMMNVYVKWISDLTTAAEE